MTIHLLAPKDQSKWPKIWHHCYKIWKASPYKIKMWHDEDIDNLLKEEDESFFNTLNTLPKIYKFDYVRYLILEKFGGAYFDMDVEIVDPSFFNKLKNEKLYIAGSFGSTGVENSIIIAKNRFIKGFWAFAKISFKNQVYNKNLPNTIENVPYKTGPIALSNFLLDLFKSIPPFMDSIQILPWGSFCQRNQDLSYSIHHYSNSWHS